MKTLSVLIRLCLLATILLPAFTSQAQTNATSIAAGDDHTLFVDGYGTLWAMGLNNVGQLGDGDTNNVNSPETFASVRRRVTALVEKFPLYGWKLEGATA